MLSLASFGIVFFRRDPFLTASIASPQLDVGESTALSLAMQFRFGRGLS